MKIGLYWSPWSEWIELRSGSKRRSRRLMHQKIVLANLVVYDNPPGHRWEGKTYTLYGASGEPGPVCRSAQAALKPFAIEDPEDTES